MSRRTFHTHPVTRLAAGGSLLAAGAGVGTLGAAMFAQSASATGTTFVVTTLDDPASLDPGNCITPVADACSLREAIEASNGAPGADTITFDPSLSGTIVLNRSLDPLFDSLTITGPGADVITVEGNRTAWGFLEDPSSIGNQAAADFNLEISGLHLNGMNAQFPGGDITLGAITVFTGDLTVRDVTVSDSASQMGGGSYLVGGPISAGLLSAALSDVGVLKSATFERVNITNNSALNNANNNIIGNSSSILAIAENIDLIDSTVTDNSAASLGAPLLVGRDVNVSGTTITDNTSLGPWAGLLMITQNCSVSGSVIDHNQSQGNAGLFLLSGSQQFFGPSPNTDACIVSDTSLSYNTASSGGGSVLYGKRPIELNRVTVVGNISAPSGVQPLAQDVQTTSTGFYAALAVGGDIWIYSSTIANNTGDAILLSASNTGLGTGSVNSLSTLGKRSINPRSTPNEFYSTLHISHSTISGNSGTGINATPTPNYQPTAANVELDHALIYGNGTGPSGDMTLPSTARFSLIGAAATPPVNGAGGGNLLGVNPMLQPLKRTSPLLSVVPILLGSAAWNAGDPAFVPPPATDQRGLPRVVDVIDIGAYEVQEVATPSETSETVVVPAFTG